MNHKPLSMNFGQGEKIDKKMKKKLIYTLAFLLSGTFIFSSCNDMLNVDSNRVEYEFDNWEFSDSVYSVLGILKAVQEVGDRQVLINELRADLVTVNEAKAVTDVQELAKSEFNLNTNKYLDVKDYYTIINNCNIYLARVDTTLESNNVRLMLPEYVAVKSVRAWTYLQLAINYGEVPYFTEPILTHSDAENVMNTPKLTRDQIINKLIVDILPYENPSVYPMPAWEPDGKVLNFAYLYNDETKEVEVNTKQLFVPVRMLLGELFLWNGDYKNAAKFFYAQIAGTGTNETASKYASDLTHSVSYGMNNGQGYNNRFINMFAVESYNDNNSNYFAIIPYADTELRGTVSYLDKIFSPKNERGGAQVVASPGIQSLASRQVYCYMKDRTSKKETPEYSHGYKYPGDLRIKATTYSQIGTDEAQTEYKNIIAKFNFRSGSLGLEQNVDPAQINTPYIILQRKEQAYLRLAEALVGLERLGYDGALELAMEILKVGPKKEYRLMNGAEYETRVKLDANGDTIFRNDTIPVTYEQLVSCKDSLKFDFTAAAFESNEGIHSRGSGCSERNAYYTLNDTCIARYMGIVKKENNVEVFNPDEIKPEDEINYVADLIIDELALELAWEGTRFGDLIRFAKSMGDNDVLAKRVAGRAYMNDVTYRNSEYQMDTELYGKMSNEANWYLPLPESVVTDDIPTGKK